MPIEQFLLMPLLTAPGNHQSAFCIHGFAILDISYPKPFLKEQKADSWDLVPLRVSSCVGLSIVFCLPLLQFPHLKNGHKSVSQKGCRGHKGII